MNGTVLWQRFEGAILLAAGLAIWWQHREALPWGWAILCFFAPDISFAGYCFGPKMGALFYNAVHVYAFGAICAGAGLFMDSPLLLASGALWFAHSGFDRMLGYGLKLSQRFTLTHLGEIGKRP